MFGQRVLLMQAFLCLMFALPAHAYINAPFLTPAAPHAGQAVFVNVDSGVCDTFEDQHGYPQITQNGSHIRVVLLAIRETDSDNCNLPSGLSTFAIGGFAAGNYDVSVDVFYYDFHGNPQNETIGVLPLLVQAAAAAPVGAPASTPLGLLLLAASLIAVALWKQRASALSLLALALLSGHVRADAQLPNIDGNRTIEVIWSRATGAPSLWVAMQEHAGVCLQGPLIGSIGGG